METKELLSTLSSIGSVADKLPNDLTELETLAKESLECWANSETKEDDAKWNKVMDYITGKYKSVSKKQAYDKIKSSNNPMHAAIRMWSYSTIRYRDKTDPDTKDKVRVLEKVQTPIDLGDLHTKLGGVGHDPQWINMVEVFNYHLTLRAANRVGATIKTDNFRMRKLSKQINLGKDPTSNTQLLKTLQSIVTAMLGDGYKALSHDVNYLVDVYVNDDRRSKTAITAANHRVLRGYIKKICYRVLTGGIGYAVVQKEIKEDK